MVETYFERAKWYLVSRAVAYQRTFVKDAPDTDIVLADLAKFCRASESTFNPDPRIHALMEGRREVFLRITQHLNLSPDELWEIYGKQPKG